MSVHIQKDYKYTKNHIWVSACEGDALFVGISHYGQERLGDVIYLEMPEDGEFFKQDEVFGVIESVGETLNLRMPVSGTILEVNPDINGSPELINECPYAEGWLLHVKPEDLSEIEQLLEAGEYLTQTRSL